MPEFSARQKADCAEREVRQRQRVYPRIVAAGKFTQAFADEQVAIMQAIAEDYRAAAEAEESKGRLL